MGNIGKELDFHFRDFLLDINVVLHLNHEESQTQTEIEGCDAEDYIDKSCPPTQPPRWENGDSQCTCGYKFRISFIHRFYTEYVVSGRNIGIRSNTVFAVIVPFLLIPFEYVTIRYAILIVEI